jgi:leader peptidase (prepilin peptidase)/N-methyltransferase
VLLVIPAALLAFAMFSLSQRAILAWSAAGVTSQSATGLKARPMPWHAPAGRDQIARVAAALVVLVAVVAFARFETAEAVRVTLVATALVTCSATDLLSFRVPNAVTLPAIGFCFAWSLFPGTPEPAMALVAGGVCGGLLLLASLLTRRGLGGGDVKLGLLAGVALGLPMAPITLGVGVVVGSLTVITLHLRRDVEREEGLPFAPFIALPAVLALLLS